MEKKEEPDNAEIEATTGPLWWRPRSVVSLKLLAYSSSFVSWLRTAEFMHK